MHFSFLRNVAIDVTLGSFELCWPGIRSRCPFSLFLVDATTSEAERGETLRALCSLPHCVLRMWSSSLRALPHWARALSPIVQMDKEADIIHWRSGSWEAVMP